MAPRTPQLETMQMYEQLRDEEDYARDNAAPEERNKPASLLEALRKNIIIVLLMILNFVWLLLAGYYYQQTQFLRRLCRSNPETAPPPDVPT